MSDLLEIIGIIAVISMLVMIFFGTLIMVSGSLILWALGVLEIMSFSWLKAFAIGLIVVIWKLVK